jgi:hypothetical protein
MKQKEEERANNTRPYNKYNRKQKKRALRLIKNISNTSQTNFKAAYKINTSNKLIYIQNSKQPAQIQNIET